MAMFGTGGNDRLVGTSAGEEILGFAGDDTLLGNGGDDTLDGGDGIDVLDGGDGNDEIDGDRWDATLIGGPGDDDIWVNGDTETVIDAGPGNDTVSASDNDLVTLGSGADEISIWTTFDHRVTITDFSADDKIEMFMLLITEEFIQVNDDGTNTTLVIDDETNGSFDDDDTHIILDGVTGRTISVDHVMLGGTSEGHTIIRLAADPGSEPVRPTDDGTGSTGTGGGDGGGFRYILNADRTTVTEGDTVTVTVSNTASDDAVSPAVLVDKTYAISGGVDSADIAGGGLTGTVTLPCPLCPESFSITLADDGIVEPGGETMTVTLFNEDGSPTGASIDIVVRDRTDGGDGGTDGGTDGGSGDLSEDFVALSYLMVGTAPEDDSPIHDVAAEGGSLRDAAAEMLGYGDFLSQFGFASNLEAKVNAITTINLGLSVGSEAHTLANSFFIANLTGGVAPNVVFQQAVTYLLNDAVRAPMFDAAAATLRGEGAAILSNPIAADADVLGIGAAVDDGLLAA